MSTFSAAFPELAISNGSTTSLPAWAFKAAVAGLKRSFRTRITSISIGTTNVGDPGAVKRVSAATTRPARALAGIPIVTPTLFRPRTFSVRAREPRTAKSPRGMITTSTSGD